jgi:hypothetical protein
MTPFPGPVRAAGDHLLNALFNSLPDLGDLLEVVDNWLDSPSLSTVIGLEDVLRVVDHWLNSLFNLYLVWKIYWR